MIQEEPAAETPPDKVVDLGEFREKRREEERKEEFRKVYDELVEKGRNLDW